MIATAHKHRTIVALGAVAACLALTFTLGVVDGEAAAATPALSFTDVSAEHGITGPLTQSYVHAAAWQR